MFFMFPSIGIKVHGSRNLSLFCSLVYPKFLEQQLAQSLKILVGTQRYLNEWMHDSLLEVRAYQWVYLHPLRCHQWVTDALRYWFPQPLRQLVRVWSRRPGQYCPVAGSHLHLPPCPFQYCHFLGVPVHYKAQKALWWLGAALSCKNRYTVHFPPC